jgi:hypothetical protein
MNSDTDIHGQIMIRIYIFLYRVWTQRMNSDTDIHGQIMIRIDIFCIECARIMLLGERGMPLMFHFSHISLLKEKYRDRVHTNHIHAYTMTYIQNEDGLNSAVYVRYNTRGGNHNKT